ncbi:MAG: AmmeMemoRadiSam system protein A [Myxococcota bacterium]
MVDLPHAMLDEAQRHWLLSRARDVMRATTRGERLPALEPHAAALDREAGCFVTLHAADGALRGCIGTFDATRPLCRAVDEMAIAACARDPRFAPVEESELPQCSLEISVLGPRRVVGADEIEVGRHGVCVRRGWQNGVLLPQVASEQGWDRETFLAHTCRKAGLPADAWRDGSVQIEVFEAQVFGEITR